MAMYNGIKTIGVVSASQVNNIYGKAFKYGHETDKIEVALHKEGVYDVSAFELEVFAVTKGYINIYDGCTNTLLKREKANYLRMVGMYDDDEDCIIITYYEDMLAVKYTIKVDANAILKFSCGSDDETNSYNFIRVSGNKCTEWQ